MNILIGKKQYLLPVIAVMIIYLIWDFGIRPSRQKNLEFTGVIEKTYKSRSWIRPNEGVFTGDPDYRNRFFWRIKTDNGKTVNVEINRNRWKKGQPGMRVQKIKGQQEPALANRSNRSNRTNKTYQASAPEQQLTPGTCFFHSVVSV